jgi:hypothetical protein
MNGIDTPWKYCYWLDQGTFEKLKKQMEEKGMEIVYAKQTPCEALRGDIGCAEPQSWTQLCKYDAAPWYHSSPKAGKYMVISSSPLGNEYHAFLEATIVQTSFEPPYLPSAEEKVKLIQDEGYRSHEPPGWGTFPQEVKEKIVQLIAQMTGSVPEPFADLFLTWTAVHANFVNPGFRAGESLLYAPYSIADSLHISSCCVELFNIVTSPEKALLVRPCAGSLMMEVLEKDRYYLVRPVKRRQLGQGYGKTR